MNEYFNIIWLRITLEDVWNIFFLPSIQYVKVTRINPGILGNRPDFYKNEPRFLQKMSLD